MVVKAAFLVFSTCQALSSSQVSAHLSSKQLPLISTTGMFRSRVRELKQESLEDLVKPTQSKRWSLRMHPGSLGSELEISPTPCAEINYHIYVKCLFIYVKHLK